MSLLPTRDGAHIDAAALVGSLDPDDDIVLETEPEFVSVASMRPSAGFASTISHPRSRAAASALLNASLDWDIQKERSQIGIGSLLLCGDHGALISTELGASFLDGRMATKCGDASVSVVMS